MFYIIIYFLIDKASFTNNDNFTSWSLLLVVSILTSCRVYFVVCFIPDTRLAPGDSDIIA